MTGDSNCLDAESLIHELFTFHESDLHMKSKVVKIERRISLRRIDESHAIERQRACRIPCAAHLESRQMSGSGRQKERASVSTRNCVRRGQKQLRRVFGIEPNVLGIEIGGPVHRLPRSEADL